MLKSVYLLPDNVLGMTVSVPVNRAHALADAGVFLLKTAKGMPLDAAMNNASLDVTLREEIAGDGDFKGGNVDKLTEHLVRFATTTADGGDVPAIGKCESWLCKEDVRRTAADVEADRAKVEARTAADAASSDTQRVFAKGDFKVEIAAGDLPLVVTRFWVEKSKDSEASSHRMFVEGTTNVQGATFAYVQMEGTCGIDKITIEKAWGSAAITLEFTTAGDYTDLEEAVDAVRKAGYYDDILKEDHWRCISARKAE